MQSYQKDEQIDVNFKDGSTVKVFIQSVDEDTGDLFCSVLSPNKAFKQGDELIVNPLNDAITKSAIKYDINDDPQIIPPDESLGILVIGSDTVGVDQKGERVPYSYEFAQVYSQWAVGTAGNSITLRNFAKKGYPYLAIVVYESVLGGMRNNPSYKKALLRAIEDMIVKYKLPFNSLQELLQEAEAFYSQEPKHQPKQKTKKLDSPDIFGNTEVQYTTQNKLTRGKLIKYLLDVFGINEEEVAKAISVENHEQMVGKIIAISKFAGITTGKDRSIKHEVYSHNIILENFVEVNPPISFKELTAHLPDQKNIWLRVRSYNFTLPKSIPQVQYLMELAEAEDVTERKVAGLNKYSLSRIKDNANGVGVAEGGGQELDENEDIIDFDDLDNHETEDDKNNSNDYDFAPEDNETSEQEIHDNKTNPILNEIANQTAEVDKTAMSMADKYLKTVGLPAYSQSPYQKLDESLGRSVAEAYDQMEDAPDDKYVEQCYSAFVNETVKQYNFLPVKIVFTEQDPYKNSLEMFDDIKMNRTMKVFSGGEPNVFMTGTDDKGISVNNKFRAVHDYWGHFMNKSQFGRNGEYNAFISHSKMYSDLGKRALATETLGQNSWFNFSRHNEGKPRKEKDFAPQKVGILPEELLTQIFESIE